MGLAASRDGPDDNEDQSRRTSQNLVSLDQADLPAVIGMHVKYLTSQKTVFVAPDNFPR